jgi:hypothetical protein
VGHVERKNGRVSRGKNALINYLLPVMVMRIGVSSFKSSSEKGKASTLGPKSLSFIFVYKIRGGSYRSPRVEMKFSTMAAFVSKF